MLWIKVLGGAARKGAPKWVEVCGNAPFKKKKTEHEKKSEGIAAFLQERCNKLTVNCSAVRLDGICLLNGTPKKQKLVYQRNIHLCW